MTSNSELDKYHKILTKVAARIEKECGLKNGAWIATLILLFIDADTWTVDKSYLARLYQAVDIIEHNDELKNLFKNDEKIEE